MQYWREHVILEEFVQTSNNIYQSEQPSNTVSSEQPSNIASNEHLRRSDRQRCPPRKLQDYYYDATIRSRSSPHLLSKVITLDALTPSHKAFSIAVTSIAEPKSYNQAIKSSHWKKATDAEIRALQDNNTWELVELPPSKIPIGCKWVYKIKLKVDGTVERYKARLVAKGYTQ